MFNTFSKNVETNLIQSYKENPSYTEPLCIPLTILDTLDTKISI